MYLQQGDVLLQQVHMVPDGAYEVTGNVLHEGVNHRHMINGNGRLFVYNERYYLDTGGCQITHNEHHVIDVPAGYYRKEIVQEYDHWDEEARDVID